MNSKLWKFGGLALLALAITAIPTLSHASTIDSGGFVSGTMSPAVVDPVAGDIITIRIVGTTNTVTLVTGALMGGPGFFSFTGGMIDITNSIQGTFADALTGGTLFGGGGSFVAGGLLAPIPGLTTGSTSVNWTITNGTVVGGTGGVNFIGTLTFIPEPGTLGMMGTGLIGLAGLLKRKLKLS